MKRRIFLITMLVLSNIVDAQEASTADGAASGGTPRAAGGSPVMVVTGAKVAEDVREAVTAVEVVSREDIEAMGAKNVEEVMANIPGVVIFQMAQSTVMMQGFEGAYVKVLVDGVEVTGDTGGAVPVNTIPVSGIERIEIVRGASSVLYGSDAMGGVINIITKKPEKDKLTLQTRHEFASNLRYFGEAFAGYDSKHFAFSLGGSFDIDDGKILPTKNILGRMVNFYEVPYIRLAGLRGNAAWHHPGGSLELSGVWGDSFYKMSQNTQNGYSFAYPKIEVSLRDSYKISDSAAVDGIVSYHRVDYESLKYDYLRGTSATDGKSLFQDIEGEFRFAWEPLISHALLFGINAKREALESDSFYDEKQQISIAAFAQDTWNIKALDKFRVVPGLRLDARLPNEDDEDTIVKLTPKLAFRYDPTEKIALRFSYGMGFKTPSLKQNYWVFFHPQVTAGVPGFVVLGNPNLKPETSHGFNLSAGFSILPQLSVSAGAYFNYIIDMIDALPDSDEDGERQNASGQIQNYHGTYLYQNVGKAITAGGDISVKFSTKRVNLMAAYNLVIAKGWDDDMGGGGGVHKS
jgi:outer membrane receptor for ferrienterochelin and colicins